MLNEFVIFFFLILILFTVSVLQIHIVLHIRFVKYVSIKQFYKNTVICFVCFDNIIKSGLNAQRGHFLRVQIPSTALLLEQCQTRTHTHMHTKEGQRGSDSTILPPAAVYYRGVPL